MPVSSPGSEALVNGSHRRHADSISSCGYATTDLGSYQHPKLWLKVIDSDLGSTRVPTSKRVSMKKHPDTPCDCVMAASPLAFHWCCPACGKKTIMKSATVAAVCDGVRMRKGEPEAVRAGAPT
jgi:predicted RNA-binding Zn-ribbon protein involved in translation (DUF1610 family)